MNYIINPAWVYWLNIVDGLHVLFVLLGSLMLVLTSGTTIWYICTLVVDADEDQEAWTSARERKVLKPFLKFGWVITVVFMLAALFIPTKNTLLEMQIAKFATTENAEKALEAVKSAADYVVESIKSLR